MTGRSYETDGVTVHWDSDVCIHSGVCARTLPRVFRPRERPWITLEEASADEIIATVEQCPSGALRYTRTDPTTRATGGDVTQQPEPTADDDPVEVTITVSENGPYEVRGPVRIVASDGVTIKEGEKVWLCRCGHSKVKPFCDSSHKAHGFTDSGLGAKREKDAAG